MVEIIKEKELINSGKIHLHPSPLHLKQKGFFLTQEGSLKIFKVKSLP